MMAARGPFSSMTLIQSTITFVVAFIAINILIRRQQCGFTFLKWRFRRSCA